MQEDEGSRGPMPLGRLVVAIAATRLSEMSYSHHSRSFLAPESPRGQSELQLLLLPIRPAVNGCEAAHHITVVRSSAVWALG